MAKSIPTSAAIGIIVLLFWLVPIFSYQEIKPVTDVRTEIFNQTLFMFWTITPDWGNYSDVIQFNVKYCPNDRTRFWNSQDCMVNVTICEANYSTLSSLPPTIITHQHYLAEHLNKSNTPDLLLTNDRPVLLSSGWNSKRREFMCAIHNLKRCYYCDGWKLGDLLITDSENFTKIKEIQPPVNLLKKPENISIIQNRSSVTIKWSSYYECWRYGATPDDYNVSLESNDKHLARDTVVPATFEKEANSNWECSFRGLRPFTVYTVKIYGIHIRDQIPGPVAQQIFKTNEAAPLNAPTILCSMCSATNFEDYRNVEVKWELPVKKSWNGIIRLAVLRYWGESDNETQATLEIRGHNQTHAILSKLKQDVSYRFQIKICTMVGLCSRYSELGYIAENVKNLQSDNKDNPNQWIIGLVVGFCVAVFVTLCLVFIIWNWRKNGSKKSNLETYQLSEQHILENGMDKDNADVYNYLPSKEQSESFSIKMSCQTDEKNPK